MARKNGKGSGWSEEQGVRGDGEEEMERGVE